MMVSAILVAGCTQPGQIVPVSTPTPTATPSLAATTPPGLTYVTLLTQGKNEIDLAKSALDEGKAYLADAMTKQSQKPDVIIILGQARANFTLAKSHFQAANTAYREAQSIAPPLLTTQLTILIDSTNDCSDACDMFLNAVTLAGKQDWYNADNQANTANLKYRTAIGQINDILNGLNMLT
ncbi:MAG: hypothetical protein LUO88_00780 [Methanoregulaceae archaeon]|nr:hypothetical protein [Methanoregulaceae archaeon]